MNAYALISLFNLVGMLKECMCISLIGGIL